MTSPAAAALALSDALVEQPWNRPPAAESRLQRHFALGDPQGSREALFGVLERHGLLGADGWLAPGVSLVSIGDHFDYGGEVDEAAREGERFLRWLAAHAPAQVTILAGNHDLVRVCEFASMTDARFTAARALAAQLATAAEPDRTALEALFRTQFPDLPSTSVARRDFSAFRERQRRLVQELLLSRRMRLASTTRLRGRPALLTHAGVTERELALLGLGRDASPQVIAAALNARLDAAVDRVRVPWNKGDPAPLSLAPLHVAGVAGREGGGLLYHRPARSDRGAGDLPWEQDPERPRRFDPRSLPIGLMQICGHCSHHKCLVELEGWVDASARAAPDGRLRTLVSAANHVVYSAGVHVPDSDVAVLVMIDPSLARTPPDEVELLELEAAAGS